MLHDINVGYFTNLVLYSIPLIGRVIYLDCMKYHSITIGGGGGGSKISLCITRGEGVQKGSILSHEINEQPLTSALDINYLIIRHNIQKTRMIHLLREKKHPLSYVIDQSNICIYFEKSQDSSFIYFWIPKQV